KYAERLVNIRKILLTVKNPYSDSVYEDVDRNGRVDVRDLIATKEAAANNFAANGADNQVKAWKAEHLTGSNATAEELYKGTKYYIDAENGDDSNSGTSPEDAWQSLTKAASVRSGNTVLFKAGQTFRNTSINSGIFDDKASAVLTTKSGVTYGAYGEGAKPVLSGSAYNYADKNSVSWSNDGNGIWKTGVNNSSAGIVVYNGGELIGNMTVSKAALATAQDGDFYHDGNYIYVKSSTGNPADKWNDIEIGVYRSVIDLSEGVTIDNIAVMYTGYHGMESSATESNITITNCVVSYIGGSVMKGTRLGNGIQFGISGSNLTVENCYVSECYDAGLTFQTWSGEGNGYWINLTFKNNLVENCHYSFEWFGIGTEGSNEGTEIKNISVDSNIFVGAGYGWSYDEREDFGASSIQVSHFRGGSNKSYYKNMSNFQFTNNILDGSKKSLVYWYWTHETEAEITSENFSASGNSFYQRSGCDDYILNYKDQPLLNGCSRGKVREALEKFEATTTPTGNAEFIYDDQVVILK
ncbi:MAG: right-handed parallel beta-helix repeat-containing protein, partial [Clostridia bacterium]|nr:right-handed parallel beta-helix repeat-containing protein [Clostridia bacterium]